jgi:O-antigen/teichoic acid export membrane protein
MALIGPPRANSKYRRIDSMPVAATNAVVSQSVPFVRLARKGGFVLGIRLVGAGTALALQVCLARTLGYAEYGEVAYVLAWLQLVLIFAQGGFATAALRYVAEYRARCQPALARGFLRRSTQFVLLVSVVLAVMMAGTAALLHCSGIAVSAWHFLIAGATLPVLAQFALCSATVRALGHVIPSMIVGLAQPLLLLGALLTTSNLLRLHVSSSDALLMYLAAAVCALSMAFALQRRAECQLEQAQQPEFRTGEWLTTAMHFLIVSGMFHLQGRTGVVLTGLLLDERSAGTYAVVERFADAALLGLTSVNLLAAPRFAALHAEQRRLELQRYARLAAWGACGFMVATVAPLVLFGEQLLRLYGDEFVAGYPVLLVLLGGVAVSATCGSVGFLLIMTGYQRDTVVVAFSGVCLNLILCLLLIHRYGIIGTSIANAVSMGASSVAMVLLVRQRLGMWCIGMSSG